MARDVRKKQPTQTVFELACEAQDLEDEELEGLDRLQILDQSVLRSERSPIGQIATTSNVSAVPTPYATTKTLEAS